jgi:hypothetical protein
VFQSKQIVTVRGGCLSSPNWVLLSTKMPATSTQSANISGIGNKISVHNNFPQFTDYFEAPEVGQGSPGL